MAFGHGQRVAVVGNLEAALDGEVMRELMHLIREERLTVVGNPPTDAAVA